MANYFMLSLLCSLSVFFVLFGHVSGDTLCPDMWVAERGSCYLFALHNASSYMDAEQFCSGFDSRIVIVEDAVENEFIKYFLRDFRHTPWWIGLSDGMTEGDWRWTSTGDMPVFTDWAPHEPNSYNGQHDEDCGVMHSSTNFQWVDDLCSLNYPPICERDANGLTEVIG